MSDSFSAFRLHCTPNSTTDSSGPPRITISSLTQPPCICAHCAHLFTFNHHLGYVGEQEGGGSQQNSRWSPTPAQLLCLEELYRQGTKTPTAEQIQQIASQLRRFGKIEGKNVFYWFQNHKARERQKRRRCDMGITASSAQEKELYVTELSSEKPLEQEARQGLRGTGYEVKETKKWASTSNCSGLAEVSASLDIAERGAKRWTQSEQIRETQILRSKRGQRQEEIADSNPLKNISSPATFHTQTSNPLNLNYYDEEIADSRTLKLFPPKRDEDGICLTERNDKFCAIDASMDSEITSNQFFEFLPLRN